MGKSKYTLDVLEPIVRSSKSLAGVLRKLGIGVNGGNHRYIKMRIKHLGISTEHFTGQGWARGKTKETDQTVASIARQNSIPDSKVFVENSTYAPGKLRHRLLAIGWDYKCANCEISEWLGEELTLHVDHINGVSGDHRLENLRFLCPNCHQQTETWGNRAQKKQGSVAQRQEARVLGTRQCGFESRPAQSRKKKCKDCGVDVLRQSTRCRACANRRKPCKIKWPSDQKLLSMISAANVNQVAKQLGVSYNAVKKHVSRIKRDRAQNIAR